MQTIRTRLRDIFAIFYHYRLVLGAVGAYVLTLVLVYMIPFQPLQHAAVSLMALTVLFLAIGTVVLLCYILCVLAARALQILGLRKHP